MARLHDLTGDYVALYAKLKDCETEEQAQEIMDAIEAVEADIAVKAENYARALRNKVSEAEMYAAEIKRLTEKKRIAESSAERLKGSIKFAMETAGATEIYTSIGKWKIRRNPPSVTITDETSIPAEYLIPQPSKVDKKGILQAYKTTGEYIPGTDIVQTDGVSFR